MKERLRTAAVTAEQPDSDDKVVACKAQQANIDHAAKICLRLVPQRSLACFSQATAPAVMTSPCSVVT